MAFQPTLVLSSSTVEMDSEPSTRASTGLTSEESVAFNTPEVQSSEKQEYEETVASAVAPTQGGDDYPDGGFTAWCVVFGSVCASFSTSGLASAWGVFQSYYERILMPGTPTSTIAWIGSIQYAFIFLPGFIAGRLCDLGYFKRTMFVSSVILVVATALTAECKEYWQFLICQGLLTGLACGMIFCPLPAITAQWFEKRRSLASGVIFAGAPLGGTIIPIVARNLVDLIGFKWMMRVIALIELLMLGIANLTLRRRLDPPQNTGPFFSWHDFKKPAFNVYILCSVLIYLGFFTLLNYIDLSATTVGISPEFSFYLVSFANAGAGLGRVSSGFFADKFGPLTVTGPLTLLCAIVTYVWPFVTTKGSLVAIAVIYGLCSGAYGSLRSLPVVMMGDVHNAGRRTGTATTVTALGAIVGPPISGAIAQGTGGFKAVGYYAGSSIVGGVAFMYLTKYLMIGSLRGKF